MTPLLRGIFFAAALTALGCNPRVREGTVLRGDACTRTDDCPIGSFCKAPCSLGQATCVAGCVTDADCEFGHCDNIYCAQCEGCPVGTCSP